MNLTISGHHIDVTPALRQCVITKLDRIIRHFSQMINITVLLTAENLREGRRQKVEITICAKGKKIFLKQVSESMYSAIDQLMSRLDTQVCRHKGKVQKHDRKNSRWKQCQEADVVTVGTTEIPFVPSGRPAIVLGDFTVASANEPAYEVIRRAMHPLGVSAPTATSTA